jgi:hypothetical protein
MREESRKEVERLTGRICDLTLAKDKRPEVDINGVINVQIREIRSQALLLRGCPQEFQALSFRAWEGQPDD